MTRQDHIRSYRKRCRPGSGETSCQVVIEQSDLFIISTTDVRSRALERLNMIRSQIKNYIFLHPEFGASLSPVQVRATAPDIIRNMAQAAELFNVGPMAAVAGAVAQDIADYLARENQEVLVENGGDIFIRSQKDRVVGLLPHPHEPLNLGLAVRKDQTPCSVCSSSASIGHSLSLGKGDLVAVMANSGAVADAAATAICNLLQTRKSMAEISRDKNSLFKKGITGILAQMGEDLLVVGDMELTFI
ncbi:UPF0280 family protein [Desulfonatronovibrio hydrogenovorans]|uniref:UPF0280 family protein n=1 Tax=Desulfonatronovibrio hydrogenovorans TaxID=53245 RepID=UPI00048F3FB9|nr:UPF0280 family protein [Desulfonatronovibrio hydrogenovorans]